MNIFKRVYNYFKFLTGLWDISRHEEISIALYKKAMQHLENKNSFKIIKAGRLDFMGSPGVLAGYYDRIFKKYGIQVNKNVDIDYLYQLFVNEYDRN